MGWHLVFVVKRENIMKCRALRFACNVQMEQHLGPGALRGRTVFVRRDIHHNLWVPLAKNAPLALSSRHLELQNALLAPQALMSRKAEPGISVIACLVKLTPLQ